MVKINANLKNKKTGAIIIPNTTTLNVADVAKNQALSATLVNTPDKSTLGYPAFSTVTNYAIGDKVYYNNKIYKFKAAHSAGAWNDAHVDEMSIKEDLKDYSDTKISKVSNPTVNNIPIINNNGELTDSNIGIDKISHIDGFYEGMGVGVAKRLEGNTDVAGSFLERTTGGDAELANGLAQLNEVQGGSVKFNQTELTPPTETSTTLDGTTAGSQIIRNVRGSLVNGHKVFCAFFIKADEATEGKIIITDGVFPDRVVSLTTEYQRIANISTIRRSTAIVNSYIKFTPFTASTATITTKCFFRIDLTDIFGEGNEPSTVAEFEAWLAENVGLKDYYDYTDGEVVNNNMTGIESKARNLFNPTTGKARIIGAYSEVYGNYYGIVGTHGTLTFEDDLGNVSTVTPDADGKFELDVSGYLSVADAGNDVAVFLWWDGKKTEYEDYDVDIAHLDVRHVYGKKNGTGELVQVWPTGMPRINDVVDKLCIENGAVVAKRPLGEVDMGTLSFTYLTSEGKNYFFVALADVAALGIKIKPSTYVCPKYEFKGRRSTSDMTNADTGLYDTVTTDAVEIRIKDTNYTDAATLKTSLDGVLLYYELATPETYTDLVYMGSEYFADGTPVALPVNYKVDNWGVESILPKNTSTILTAKPTIKVRYSIDAVEQLDTHSDQIEDLYDGLDELDGAKANTVGVYDDMVVGAAKAIAGNQRLDKVFTSMVVDGADGVDKINEVRGKSLVWNQLVNTDTTEVATVNGHKYLTKINGVKSITTSTGAAITINDVSTDRVFDLTQMFGAGNEPATVEEFENLFPDAYYEYNAGEIINNATEELDVTGFNQWDEEWEEGGINGSTGQNSTSDNSLRSKNHIPVISGATYYFKNIAGKNNGDIFYYDVNKNYLYGEWNKGNRTFIVPTNCKYIRFATSNHYGSTYNNDLCINISDPSRNDTYEPYKHGIVPLNLSTITGKQVGVEDAESEVIFPDGMRQAGGVADTLLVDDDGYARRTLVKIGSRAYQSGDESDSTVVTDLTNTLYALETASEYILDEPILMTFKAYHGGTIVQSPQAPNSAPMSMNVTFALDAVGTLNNLPKNYISADSMDAFLAQLGTAMNGTWTKSWDAANNRYGFTFTPNTQGE